MKNLVLFLSCCIFTLSANAQQWRLQKIIYSNEGITNSIRTFFYSGTRGSDFKNGIINYDTSYFYEVRDTGWLARSRQVQKYDSADRQIYFGSRSIDIPGQLNDNSSSLGIYTTYSPTGKVANIITSINGYKKRHEISRSIYTYDTADVLVEKCDSSSIIGNEPLITTNKHYYYDTAYNLSQTITRQITYFSPTIDTYYQKTDYYYDTNNVLERVEESYAKQDIPGSYVPESKTVYTYDINGRLKITEVWDRDLSTGTLLPYTKVINFYTTGPKPTTVETYGFDKTIMAYGPPLFVEYFYNSDNDVTSTLYKSWDKKSQSLLLTMKKEIVYNGYKQPDTIKEWEYRYLPSKSDTIFSKETHIYEIHWPTDANTITTNNTSLILYPNPAADIITIRAEFEPRENLIVAVYNFDGKVVKQWSEHKPAANYLKTIQVSELPPGNYIIKLSGQGIQGSARFSIVK